MNSCRSSTAAATSSSATHCERSSTCSKSSSNILHADMGALYDNWFAETCEPWLLPYIAELVSVTRLPAPSEGDPRRLTVNALAYRRRKGTVAAAGAYASDVTGWAVPCGRLRCAGIAIGQRVRREYGRGDWFDVSAIGALDALYTWQETTAHGFHVSELYGCATRGSSCGVSRASRSNARNRAGCRRIAIRSIRPGSIRRSSRAWMTPRLTFRSQSRRNTSATCCS